MGLPHFDDIKAQEEHRRALSRAIKKERAEKEERIEDARAMVHGQVPASENDSPYNEAIKDWMEDIRSGFAEYVIRRTINSRGLDGRPISGLASYWEAILPILLNTKEMEVMDELASRLGADNAFRTYMVST